MPKPSATTPFHLIYGGDPYLNEQTVRDLRHQAQRKHPDAETIEPTQPTPIITPSTKR